MKMNFVSNIETSQGLLAFGPAFPKEPVPQTVNAEMRPRVFITTNKESVIYFNFNVL